MYTLMVTLVIATPPQAPQPLQAPPVLTSVVHKSTRCGCSSSCDCEGVQGGVCDCPKARPAKRVSKATCPCSPQCECGCQQGQPCICGNSVSYVLPTTVPAQLLTNRPASSYVPQREQYINRRAPTSVPVQQTSYLQASVTQPAPARSAPIRAASC
jgi:hypothetical protein